MVDAEFARVGPCAYDMGLLLATLLLLYYHQFHVLHVQDLSHGTETDVTGKRHVKHGHSGDIGGEAEDAEETVSKVCDGLEAESGTGREVEEVMPSQGCRKSCEGSDSQQSNAAQDVLRMCSVMRE